MYKDVSNEIWLTITMYLVASKPGKKQNIFENILVLLLVGRHNVNIYVHNLRLQSDRNCWLHISIPNTPSDDFVVSVLKSHPSSYIKMTRTLIRTKFQSVFSSYILVLWEIADISLSHVLADKLETPSPHSVVGEWYVRFFCT